MSKPLMNPADWTQGGDRIVFQHCPACQHVWYFQRSFCPVCGHATPQTTVSAGAGVVHASTLVERAPNDAFRALAPYRIVLVDVDEGFRMMGHADPALAIDDRVRADIRSIAGQPLPFFHKESP